jgi:CHAD domain-containing protein
MGTAVHLEVERKYDVGPMVLLPSLAGASSVASVGRPVVHDLEATYFDTPDLVLARHGVTLRQRAGGADDGWHLKVPDGPDARTEVRAPAGGSWPPPALLDRIRPWADHDRLAPVARLRTHRLAFPLLDEEGTMLAELADDAVCGLVLTAGTHTPAGWREWEVELGEGSALHLDAVEARLLAAGAVPARAGSKLARLLGVPSATNPDPAAARRPVVEGSAEELLLARLGVLRAELAAGEAAVRGGAPESVHRMRITARRLRSVVTTFEPLLKAGSVSTLRADLQWLGRSLSPARDAQVLRARLDSALDALPPELVADGVASVIDGELEAAARDGLGLARCALAGERYQRLLGALDDLAAAPPTRRRARRPATDVLPGLLREDVRRLYRAAERAAASRPRGRDAHLHEVRKKAKRLRYAAETAASLLPAAQQVARRAEEVQDTLGMRQDAVVARQRLERFAAAVPAEGGSAVTLGILHTRETEAAKNADAAFDDAWARLDRAVRLLGWT